MAGEKIEFNQTITQSVTDYLANRPDLTAALKRRVDDPASWLVAQITGQFDEIKLGKLHGMEIDIVKVVMTIAESFFTGKVYRK
jgi:hypothetical protein